MCDLESGECTAEPVFRYRYCWVCRSCPSCCCLDVERLYRRYRYPHGNKLPVLHVIKHRVFENEQLHVGHFSRVRTTFTAFNPFNALHLYIYDQSTWRYHDTITLSGWPLAGVSHHEQKPYSIFSHMCQTKHSWRRRLDRHAIHLTRMNPLKWIQNRTRIRANLSVYLHTIVLFD
jgi:hypothetical protein